MITPSQTVGPFFGPALLRDPRNVIDGTGERVRIEGRVLDGEGQPVPDAMLEVWQANAGGRYSHPLDLPQDDFLGFGRAGTDDGGRYWIETVKPGSVGGQAPHLVVTVHARGLLNHAVTRMYFADEPSNASDATLARVPAHRRGTLLARREGAVYRWDVVLQGEGETAFFRL